MDFVAYGLNYKTAPLCIRERIALPVPEQDAFLQHLVRSSYSQEALFLSTCNRTEIYAYTENPEQFIHALNDYYFQAEQFSPAYFYHYVGDEGIKHALRVASGLDSMMIGEPQIFGQMKQAYQLAAQAGTLKNNLRPVFEYIFSAAKRIRTQSTIGHNPLSIAHAAVQLIGKLLLDFKSVNALVIGSGETAALVAKYLHKEGVRQFNIASRTRENAQQLALLFNGQSLTISEIPTYLAQADVVVSATACTVPFINKELVLPALNARLNKPIIFLDLSVPRDIAPEVGELENVHLWDIDSLHALTAKNRHERQTAALQAEELVEEELKKYNQWHSSLHAKEMICAYRERMHGLAEQELIWAKNQLAKGINSHQVLEEFGARLVKKLVHLPTIGLKQAAGNGKKELLDLANYLLTVTE